MPTRRVLEGVAVLVVEDHPASARLASVVLSAAGAEVRIVESAEAAVAEMGLFRPRVAVVDLVLPGASGIAFARLVKADRKTRRVVCIAMSVSSSAELEAQACEAGFAAYVSKPIDTETFAELVARQLRGEP